MKIYPQCLPRLFPLALILSLGLWAGCTTTIPDIDEEPPRVELRLTGPGIGTQVMSNPPLDNWTADHGAPYLNLQPGRTYRFTASASDSGGVETLFFAYPAAFEITDIAPAEAVSDTLDHTTQITLFGDRGDPRTGLIVTGALHIPDTFEPHGPQRPEEFFITVFGRDFGGAAGDRNSTTMIVHLESQ